MSTNPRRALVAAVLLVATGACSAGGPTEPVSQVPSTAAPSLPTSSAEP